MILSTNQIKKAFGGQTIVSTGAFHIEENEKVALVGINGAGKSTILKMIMGVEPVDEGAIIISKDKTLGYLSQHQEMDSNNTIFEEISTAMEHVIRLESHIRDLEQKMKSLKGEELNTLMIDYNKSMTRFEQINGYAYNSEITGVLKGLGFSESEFNKCVNTLSGGQKTRISLGKLLLTKPDILLLDEPTNHLDMNSISWLENYLLNYKGAVLIVSHDRYFINRVVTKVVGVENGELTMFSGNYADFAKKMEHLRETRLREYEKQQAEIKHQEAVIEKLKSFNREKSVKRAESREKTLDKIDRIEKPITETKEMRFQLEPSVLSGNDVLNVEGLTKSFNNTLLFDQVDFQIKRGEHVAIIGDNGTGKTTLLKILNQVISADNGVFTLGSNVCIGYYDQEHHVLNMDNNIFNEISDDYPNLTNTQIRNTLAAFLFTGDEVYKKIGDLSGGERGRVSLAKLMLSEANFLILDEPTNHLDIQSKELLEQALNSYSGTILYVSHDRYFINQTATRILELNQKHFTNYIGNYDYYLEKKDLLSQPSISNITSDTLVNSENKTDWKTQKEEQAKARKRENDLKKTETRIEELELENEEVDSLLQDPAIYSDVNKCIEVTRQKEQITTELSDLYELWEELSI